MMSLTMNVVTKVTRKGGPIAQATDGDGRIGGRPAAAANQAIRKKLFIHPRVMRHGKYMVISRMPHAQHIQMPIAFQSATLGGFSENLPHSSSPMNFHSFSTAEGS